MAEDTDAGKKSSSGIIWNLFTVRRFVVITPFLLIGLSLFMTGKDDSWGDDTSKEHISHAMPFADFFHQHMPLIIAVAVVVLVFFSVRWLMKRQKSPESKETTTANDAKRWPTILTGVFVTSLVVIVVVLVYFQTGVFTSFPYAVLILTLLLLLTLKYKKPGIILIFAFVALWVYYNVPSPVDIAWRILESKTQFAHSMSAQPSEGKFILGVREVQEVQATEGMRVIHWAGEPYCIMNYNQDNRPTTFDHDSLTRGPDWYCPEKDTLQKGYHFMAGKIFLRGADSGDTIVRVTAKL